MFNTKYATSHDLERASFRILLKQRGLFRLKIYETSKINRIRPEQPPNNNNGKHLFFLHYIR